MSKYFYLIGFSEAVSFLVLLTVAMPLKYIADMPLAVKYIGWIHGVLFILYIYLAILTSVSAKWPLGLLIKALLAAFIPFGPFIFEKYRRSISSLK